MRVAHIVAVNALVVRYSAGRAGDIRGVGVVFSQLGLKNFIEKLFSPSNIVLHQHPAVVHFLDFVVSAPKSQRRVVAKTLDVVFYFLFDVFKKALLEERVRLTGKLKILPQKNTHLVAF